MRTILDKILVVALVCITCVACQKDPEPSPQPDTTLSVSSASVTVEQSGGEFKILVQCADEYTVKKPDWVEEKYYDDQGDGKMEYTYTVAAVDDARQCTIVYESENSQATVEVNQKGFCGSQSGRAASMKDSVKTSAVSAKSSRRKVWNGTDLSIPSQHQLQVWINPKRLTSGLLTKRVTFSGKPTAPDICTKNTPTSSSRHTIPATSFQAMRMKI